MVEYIINQVKPDFIQVDCKGHPGYSSYPTKVGNQAPGFVKDQLKIWREMTAEKGVALYLHYSGVWDSRAVQIQRELATVLSLGGGVQIYLSQKRDASVYKWTT
jgi:ABC-type lipoprotein export system ATPase subunit